MQLISFLNPHWGSRIVCSRSFHHSCLVLQNHSWLTLSRSLKIWSLPSAFPPLVLRTNTVAISPVLPDPSQVLTLSCDSVTVLLKSLQLNHFECAICFSQALIDAANMTCFRQEMSCLLHKPFADGEIFNIQDTYIHSLFPPY